MDPEDMQLTKEIDRAREALVKSRASFEEAEAMQLSILLSLQRRMSEKARQSKQTTGSPSLPATQTL
jgi:hypothetical protein